MDDGMKNEFGKSRITDSYSTYHPPFLIPER